MNRLKYEGSGLKGAIPAQAHNPAHGGFPEHHKFSPFISWKDFMRGDRSDKERLQWLKGDWDMQPGEGPEVDERDEVACPECAETLHCYADRDEMTSKQSIFYTCNCSNPQCNQIYTGEGGSLKEAIDDFLKHAQLKL